MKKDTELHRQLDGAVRKRLCRHFYFPHQSGVWISIFLLVCGGNCQVNCIEQIANTLHQAQVCFWFNGC